MQFHNRSSQSSTISCSCATASAKAEFLLSFHVQSANGEHVKHLSCIINLLVAVVQITKSLPESLALKLTLLEPADYLTIGGGSWVGGRASGASRGLDLLDQALVLFIEHSDVALETICLSLHVAVDLSPFVLLLASDLIFFGQELPHLITRLEEFTFLLLKLGTQTTALAVESIRWTL